MRFEVPQFIEVEDKIFGPFTWKQFIYIAGGLGVALVLYLTLPLIVFVFTGIPIIALTGFLAFHRVNNRPFSLFLESVLQYFSGTKLYLWKRRNQQTIKSDMRVSPVADYTLAPDTAQGPPPQRSINALSKKLELNTIAPNETSYGR